MEKYLAKNEFSKLTTVNPILPRWRITITAHVPSKKPLTVCFHRLLLCMYSLASNQQIISLAGIADYYGSSMQI